MGGILDKLDEWLRGLLIEGITGNLSGMFDTVNTKVGEIAGEVGQTPLAWNSGVFSMIRNLSETVIVPIAGVILTFVMCYELIQLVTEKNNLHDVDTWMFFKWIFKTFCAVLIVTNTWNIVMGMLVIQDQVWNRVSQNRDQGKSTWYFVDEFHLLLRGEVGSWSVEIWKRFRKWGGIPTGITQNIKDLLSSPEIENIFENSDFVYLLNQASGDRKILCERLNISNQQAAHISNAGPGEGLIFFGNVILPFVDDFPKDNELYSIMTTKLGETGKGENEHE